MKCGHCDKIMHDHGWIDFGVNGYTVCPGDWIVTGVHGHFVCNDGFFEANYTDVEKEPDAPRKHMRDILKQAQDLFENWLDSSARYAKDAEYWRERCEKAEKHITEAVGWAYADCCGTLDAGGDPRKTDMNGVMPRAVKDLGLGHIAEGEPLPQPEPV